MAFKNVSRLLISLIFCNWFRVTKSDNIVNMCNEVLGKIPLQSHACTTMFLRDNMTREDLSSLSSISPMRSLHQHFRTCLSNYRKNLLLRATVHCNYSFYVDRGENLDVSSKD